MTVDVGYLYRGLLILSSVGTWTCFHSSLLLMIVFAPLLTCLLSVSHVLTATAVDLLHSPATWLCCNSPAGMPFPPALTYHMHPPTHLLLHLFPHHPSSLTGLSTTTLLLCCLAGNSYCPHSSGLCSCKSYRCYLPTWVLAFWTHLPFSPGHRASSPPQCSRPVRTPLILLTQLSFKHNLGLNTLLIIRFQFSSLTNLLNLFMKTCFPFFNMNY